ncbi:hypothetical protein ACFLQ2_05650, partial [archaeon]
SDSIALSEFPLPLHSPGKELLESITQIAPTFTEDRLKILKSLVESFSNREFNSDALLSLVVEKTGVRMDQASEIVSLLFSKKQPKPTGFLLRSTLATPWFETLAVLTKKESPPLQLFSIGVGFRRGSQSCYLASGAVVSDSVSLDDGKALVKSLLKSSGLELSFGQVAATSKLFIPGTEFVILSGKSQIGRLGLASPIALSAYGVGLPVFVFEFSIEKLGVALGLAKEEKEFLYPQFFGEWRLPDAEIARLVRVGVSPSTWGKELASKIIKTCTLYSLQPAPCEFKLLEKEVGNSKVEAWLVSEKGFLCGRDIDNEVLVFDGNVISSPPMGSTTLEKKAVSGGTKTGVTFLKAFADYAGYLIEREPERAQAIKVGAVSDAADANIVVPELVRRYIESTGRELGVLGEVGLSVETRVKKLWRHEQPR